MIKTIQTEKNDEIVWLCKNDAIILQRLILNALPMKEIPAEILSNAVTTEDLRKDVIVEASDAEKQLIIDNFPKKKDNYLVVPRVIEE